MSRASKEPICIYKLGAIMTPLEVDNWCFNLKKLSSVRHKNILLRAAHGEIYSKEKLARFGLIQDQQCPRCGLVEDLRHKLIDCEYTKRIWGVAFGKSNPTGYDLDIENRILGAFRGCTATKLTLHAEILLRLTSLKDDQNYLLMPKRFVDNAIMYLLRKEKNRRIKDELEALLG